MAFELTGQERLSRVCPTRPAQKSYLVALILERRFTRLQKRRGGGKNLGKISHSAGDCGPIS
jgi:hypothetical protein